MPLTCDNPTLLSWLRWVEGFSRVLGLPYDSRRVLDISQCDSKWTPLGIGAVLACVSVVLLATLWAGLKSFLRYVTYTKSGTCSFQGLRTVLAGQTQSLTAGSSLLYQDALLGLAATKSD